MSDFVLFSGHGGPGTTVPVNPGYVVQISSSSTISGGAIGSLRSVITTGSASINSNILSRGTITLANSNTVNGLLSAANTQGITGTVVSVGSGAVLGGNLEVNGNIVVSGGTVSGRVTHPVGTTYAGPVPGLGEVLGTPNLVTFPALPAITSFPPFASTPAITSTTTITPGAYSAMKLSGNRVLTLRGPGVYIFELIDNKNNNSLLFDFQNNPTGVFRIYVHKNADLGKVSANMVNGGSASRIFTEVQGTGLGTTGIAFDIANGSPGGGNNSRWLGTVWVPYAAVNVGSGTGSSEITGALWSGTQVKIQSGVAISYVAFDGCVPPVIIVTNPTVCSTTVGGNTSVVNLTEFASYTGGGTGVFSAGGFIISDPQSYTATNGVVVTYTVTKSANCSSSAVMTITVNDRQSFGICAPASGKTNSLIGSELTSLHQIYQAGGRPTSSAVFFISGESVLIDIIYLNGKLAELMTLLPGLGLTNEIISDDGSLLVTGFFPITSLTQLNSLGSLINYVRPAFPPLGNAGITQTQGDKALRSDLVRLGYDIGGAGVKIGVLSDSYNTLPNSDIANGDLPGPANPFGFLGEVQVLKEYP